MAAEETTPSLRQRQAQLTQDEILGGARRLFAERGYKRTTVRDIAEAAGVSVQTVYDSIGSKQAIVARLNDLIDAEADIPAIARAGAESDDADFVIGTPARVTRAIVENCADVIGALVSGAAAEPELGAVLEEGHRRHMRGMSMIIGRLSSLGVLEPGLDHDEAAETIGALSDPRLALILTETYGWSLDRLEEWIAETSRMLVLGRRERPPAA